MREFDPDQKRAIASDAAVVSAGAGSGKTLVLTRRYVRLVRERQIPVDRILALTFTRKAAAEMHARIYSELRDYQDDPFVRTQLSRFDRSVISTLDSFCSMVARDGCSVYGISPEFVIDERRLTALVEERALAYVRDHGTDHSLQGLIRLLGFQSTWRDGFAAIGRDLSEVAGTTAFDLSTDQREFVTAEAKRLEAAIRADAVAIADLDPGEAKCVARAVDLARPVAESEEILDQHLDAILSIGLQCGSSRKPAVELLKAIVPELRKSVEALRIARETIARWPELEQLAAHATRFSQEIIQTKRRSGVLSYHDVVTLAIRVLTDQAELRNHYKRRFQAIMIDEFQDNNADQKALLYLLSEREDRLSDGVPTPSNLAPGKLFFVGDEKQSIYRFRGADVSVFRELSGELGTRSEELTLGANYRSEPGLVRFFNALFARTFGEARESFDATFSALRWRPRTPGVDPRVERWVLKRRERGDANYLSDLDAQAFYIARTIERMVSAGELHVRDGEGSRPVHYRDIAILLRTGGNQIRLERMLRRFSVPHVSQAARSLYLEAPVYDIYQVLQLLTYPHDRAAYAGLLRSPLVGISDEGMVRQLLSENELFSPVEALSESDRRALERTALRFHSLRMIADSQPIARTLHEIWYGWGYRYHLLRRPEYVTYLEYYELLRELAIQFEDQGLASFLDEIRRHLGQNEKPDELELLRADADAVQIMTVHRAKGLEFPVVVIAYAESAGRSSRVSDRPFYLSDQHGPSFVLGSLAPGAVRESAINYFFHAETERAKAQDLAELRRLFYVAATRAESHLFIAGPEGGPEASIAGIADEAFAIAGDSLDDPAEESHAPVRLQRVEWEPVPREHFFAAGTRSEDVSLEAVAKRYESAHKLDRTFPDLELPVTTLTERVRTNGIEVCPPWGKVDSPPLAVDPILADKGLHAEFGTYCHYLIEHAVGELLPDSAEALHPDLPSKERLLYEQDAATLALRFLRSPLMADLGRGAVEHEVPFTVRAELLPLSVHEQLLGAQLVRGVIDLLVVMDDRCIVVDFKTDRVLEPSHYAVQLGAYAIAAARLTGLTVDPLLHHLRSGTTFLFDSSPDGSILGVHEYTL